MTRVLALIAAAVIALATTFSLGADYGRSKEQVKSASIRSAVEKAWRGALVAEVYKRHDDRLTDERKAREATAAHDKALSTLDHHYADDLAAVRRAGGLRIPAVACTRTAAASGEAAGAGRPDEASSATVELPERTQERLFDLTLRADQLAEQLRALQGWIRSNGFYGTADENPGNP